MGRQMSDLQTVVVVVVVRFGGLVGIQAGRQTGRKEGEERGCRQERQVGM